MATPHPLTDKSEWRRNIDRKTRAAANRARDLWIADMTNLDLALRVTLLDRLDARLTIDDFPPTPEPRGMLADQPVIVMTDNDPTECSGAKFMENFETMTETPAAKA